MAKSLLVGATASTPIAVPSNATRYVNPVSVMQIDSAAYALHFSVAGKLSNLRAYVSTNNMTTGTVVVEIYKATSTGIGSSPTASATGVTFTISPSESDRWFADDSNVASIAADTNWTIKITGNGNANTVSYTAFEVCFTPDDGTKTMSWFRDLNGITLTAPATEYAPLCGNFLRNATESYTQLKMPVAGKIRRLFAYCGVTNTTFNVYANVNGTHRLSITGKSTTGWHAENSPTEYSFSAGDLINFEHTNTGSGGSRVTIIQCEIETATGDTILGMARASGVGITSGWFGFGTGSADYRTVEAQKALKVPFLCNVHDPWLYCWAFSSGNVGLALRDDGVTSSTMVPTATATGWVTDTSIDQVAKDSIISWRTTSTTSSNQLQNFSFALQSIDARVTAVDAEITYTESSSTSAKITAADAEVTYTAITGKVTAADSEITYTTIAGKVTAADAEVTYNERAGKITASDAEVTYTTITAQVTASDAEVTYTPVTGQITAADAEVTYAEITAKITAADAEITYSETGTPTGTITAADAEITYTTVIGQVTAADAEVTYTTVEAKITATDAEVTFTERGAQITASDAEITYTPVTGQITAADAEITHDTIVGKVTAADLEITFNERSGKVTAADAEITYNERSGKISAVDAEITYDVVAGGPEAKITAVDVQITYTTTGGPGWNWDAVRKVPDVWSAPAFPYGIVLQPNPSPPIRSMDPIRIGGTMSRWKGRNPFSKPGRVNPWDPLPLFGLIWYTWNQSNPADFSTATMQSSYFQPGYNYDGFKQALVHRIENRGGVVANEILEAAGLVQLRGECILDLASMLDVVFFGHWIPGYHAQLIKERSTAPQGTKIFLWGDFESIQQADFWSTSQNQYKSYLCTKPLGSTGGLNAYGCTIIDKGEAIPWDATKVGCPHIPKHGSLTWPPTIASGHGLDIDIYDHTGNAVHDSVNSAIVTSAFWYALSLDDRSMEGPTWYVDGIAFDNVLDNPYKGTSTLNYEATWTTQRYRDSWCAFFDAWQHWNPSKPAPLPNVTESLWGNSVIDCSYYSAARLKQRYLERFFAVWVGSFRAKTLTELYADLTAVRDNGVSIVAGVGAGGFDMGDTYYWATTPGGRYAENGTWVDIATKAKELQITNQVLAPAIQTFGTGSFMMLQDVFRRPA